MRRLLVALLLLAAARADPAQPLLPLKDGRVLFGRSVERRAKETILKTDFGALRVPADALAGNCPGDEDDLSVVAREHAPAGDRPIDDELDAVAGG